MLTYDRQQLTKHKVTTREVNEILASDNTREFGLPDSRRGNPRGMFVGFTAAGRLLEVGIEQLVNSDQVFHAMPATREYRKRYATRPQKS